MAKGIQKTIEKKAFSLTGLFLSAATFFVLAGATPAFSQCGCEGDTLPISQINSMMLNTEITMKRDAFLEAVKAGEPVSNVIVIPQNKTDLKKRCDLQGVNFKGANLSGVDLQNSDFQKSDLWMVNLQEAIQTGGDFRYSNLKQANLQGAILKGANLESVNMQGANLESADLQGANMAGSDIREARLPDALLSRANLKMADLRQAIFWQADMSGADLSNAHLNSTDLGGADLKGVKNLTIEQLVEAMTDETTILPEGVTLEGVARAKINLTRQRPQIISHKAPT